MIRHLFIQLFIINNQFSVNLKLIVESSTGTTLFAPKPLYSVLTASYPMIIKTPSTMNTMNGSGGSIIFSNSVIKESQKL